MARLLYRPSLAGKRLPGLVRVAAGAGLAPGPADGVPRIPDWLTRNELAEDPTDPRAPWIAGAARGSIREGSSCTVHLLLRGARDPGLVAALLARRTWASPAAIATLAQFGSAIS
jgi:uncharacterized membrane protein